jgi:ankyrin repeat protein
VRLLLGSEGIKPDSKDSNGYTPLMWAAGYGHEAVAELLLKKGADVEAKDNNGRTALYGAA